MVFDNEKITVRLGGRSIKASRGGYSGGRTPYGYTVDKNIRGMIVDEEQAEVVRLIFKLKQNGATYQTIVDTLNKEGYTNKSGSKWVKGVHEPILEKEE